MIVNTALQPLPYTHADYEHFETIYNGFCYLIDHKSEQSSSFYSYTQAETVENLERFWTVLEMICRSLNIELELTLDDVRHAIKGFDAKDAAELCNGGRYKRMQAQKVIAFEEDRLLDLTKTLLDKIMVRLRIFKKHSSSTLAPNIVPLQAGCQNVPMIDAPKQKTSVKPVAIKPAELLNKADSDILKAMSTKPKANMFRVDIEAASKYGRYAVTQSIKRLESMQLVCKTEGAGRKGWMITEKGISLSAGIA